MNCLENSLPYVGIHIHAGAFVCAHVREEKTAGYSAGHGIPYAYVVLT